MGIYLGNLSAKQIANRLSIKMTDEDITEMESFRCHEADVKMGMRWYGSGNQSKRYYAKVFKRYERTISNITCD